MASLPSNSLPAGTQLESSFQSSSTIDSRMPLTRPESPASDGHGHDYATPLELHREMAELKKREANGHRKKNCVIYEPVDGRKLSSDEDDGGVRIVHRHDRLFRILFFILFVFVFISICLSALSLLGFHMGKTDKSCVCKAAASPVFYAVTKPNASAPEPKPSTGIPMPSVPVTDFELRLKYLEHNIVAQLQNRITELEQKLSESSNTSMVGPPGQAGPQGEQGLQGDRGSPGQSNMRLCQGKVSTVSTRLSEPYSRIFVTTDHVKATKDFVLLGAACLAHGAAEYSLFSYDTNGTSTFYCTCAGKADTVALSPKPAELEIQCSIRWWECPLT